MHCGRSDNWSILALFEPGLERGVVGLAVLAEAIAHNRQRCNVTSATWGTTIVLKGGRSPHRTAKLADFNELNVKGQIFASQGMIGIQRYLCLRNFSNHNGNSLTTLLPDL